MPIGGRSSNTFGVTDSYAVGVASIRNDPGNELTHAVVWTDGDGARQVEDNPTKLHTLTGSTDSIDLVGGFTRLDGTSITPTAIKTILLYAPSTNAAAVTVNFGGTNGWDSAIDGSVVLKPGSSIHLVTEDAAGYAVTASTKDLIEVTGTAADVLKIGLGVNVS